VSPEAPARPQRLTRAEKQAQTRRRLLEAAAEVFIRRGLQGASVEEITAEAGFTRGAFYSNFRSKEQLFVELLHDRVYDEMADLLRRVPTDLSPVEQLRWGAKEMQRRYEQAEEGWLWALWLECLAHAARNPEFKSTAATFWSGSRETNARSFEEAFDELGRPLPIEPRHLATALGALDIGLALQHLVDPEAVPLDLYPKLFELLFGQLMQD
jgi:AcrR family transcriptional regulator